MEEFKRHFIAFILNSDSCSLEVPINMNENIIVEYYSISHDNLINNNSNDNISLEAIENEKNKCYH